MAETTQDRQVSRYQASPLPEIRLAAVSVEPVLPAFVQTHSISPQAPERPLWRSIQDSREFGDFEAYLEQYPQASFVALARARIAPLQNPTTMALTETKPAPPSTPTLLRLSAKATPADGRIRIINIVPVYQNGMALPSSRCDLEITARSYDTHRRWYDLAAPDRVLEVVLERVPVRARVEPAAALVPIASPPVPAAPRSEARLSNGPRHQDRL